VLEKADSAAEMSRKITAFVARISVNFEKRKEKKRKEKKRKNGRTSHRTTVSKKERWQTVRRGGWTGVAWRWVLG
jgi:hypothetical protein